MSNKVLTYKEYQALINRINAAAAAGTALGSGTPANLGVAAAGTSAYASHEDHVHDDSRIDTLESVATSLDSRLDTAENDIDNLQSADTSLDGRIDAIESIFAPKGMLFYGCNQSTTVGTLAFLSPFGTNVAIQTTDELRNWSLVMPFAGRVVGLYCYHNVNGTGTGGANVTVRKNAVATSMTVNHPNGVGGATSSTTANPVTFAMFDMISVSFVTVATLSSQFNGIRVTLVIEAV